MLAKLLITLLLTTQTLLPTAVQDGEVLGVASQEAGDKVVVEGPTRIINNNLGVKIASRAGVVVDVESDKILFNKKAFEPRSVASITKLMSALVFLDTNPDFNQEIEIISDDITGVGKANLLLGERVTLENLLHLSLIASDNNATIALVRATGMSRQEFVVKMNTKAKGMGLSSTSFVDPVGLSSKNISTAYEVAQILKLAMKHAMVKKILPLQSYSFTSRSEKYHRVVSTNKLLGTYLNVQGGKTGFIDEAGYCFTGFIKLKNGYEVVSVILGAPAADGRFQDTKAVVNWASENYKW